MRESGNPDGILLNRSPKGGRPSQEIASQLGVHILSVTLAEFGRRGVDGTTMDAIAAAANVSKRTLYLRFGSKEDLILRVIEYGFACHIEPVSSVRPPDGALRERLLHISTRMLNMSLKPEVLILESLAIWATKRAPDIYQRAKQLLNDGPIALIKAILHQSINNKEIQIDDIDYVSLFAFDVLIRVPRYRILVADELPNTPAAKREYLEKAMGLLMKALAP
nr:MULTISPECIES: TetR/AcrR family transcriptional regulator [unclassified Novosphingobium]